MTYKIFQGDCVQTMNLLLPDASVQCCVTSPPYFGLRDYGVDGQIGLEETPDEYVARLVEVFREVRRVLKDDGTLWLNLGDSYMPENRGENAKPRREYPSGMQAGHMHADQPTRKSQIQAMQAAGIKRKDLVGVPWMAAFALRADGWYLRQDIIWQKPNPMPESVTDRCTKSHEYIFLLAKSERYYFDHEAIKEPATGQAPGNKRPTKAARTGDEKHRTAGNLHNIGAKQTRNRRSVWPVTTKPFKGAHFATFPPDLIEPCILAGSRPGDLVLDPFGGAGTTALVATKHGRRAVLCELNPEYVALAHDRLKGAA